MQHFVAKCLHFQGESGIISVTKRSNAINKEVIVMAYKINDACIMCGACADGCPVSAIKEGDGKYVIDADTCIDCGACAEVCPVGAPEQE